MNFKATGLREIELILTTQLTPVIRGFVDTLQWLQATRTLLAKPLNPARLAEWDAAHFRATLVQPPAQASPRLNKFLGSISRACAVFTNLFIQHNAAFIPAELTTMPFYGLHGRLKAMNGGTAFTTQQAVEYWTNIAAHGEVREGFSKYGNFISNFRPLLPGVPNHIFTATDPNVVL